MVALACALDRYNAVTAEMEALSQVMSEDPFSKLGSVARKDAKSRWAKHLSELLTGHMGELRFLAEALPVMCDGVSELVLVTRGMPEVVDQFKNYHMEYSKHFGAGYAHDTELDYLDGFHRQQRVMQADAPGRSKYGNQAGLHGLPAKYIESKHQHSKSNVKIVKAKTLAHWIAGMVETPDGYRRNRATDPDQRFIGGTEHKRLR